MAAQEWGMQVQGATSSKPSRICPLSKGIFL